MPMGQGKQDEAIVVQVYQQGKPSGFPVQPDSVSADAEGFTLVFDPELRWYSWRERYSFRASSSFDTKE